MRTTYDTKKVIPSMNVSEALCELDTQQNLLELLIQSSEAEYRDEAMKTDYKELARRKREINQYINELEHTIAYLRSKK